MPGFGKSTARNVSSDYAHEQIITGLPAMLHDVGRSSAVWFGHDWGATVGSSIAAVHPQVVDAMAWLTVPYKTVELGYLDLLQYVNRTVYPEPTFHYAQWDYQRYYNTNIDRTTPVFQTNYEYSTKALYPTSGGNASVIGTRSSTAYITADNGWFCGADKLPPPPNITCPQGQAQPLQTISLSDTVLDDSLYQAVLTALKNTTFVPPDGYYVNQEANKAYNLNQKNGGNLTVPCLFIEAKYDLTLDTVDSSLLSLMLKHCKDFSFASLATGHWVQLEMPVQTNMAIANWLKTKLPASWPGGA